MDQKDHDLLVQLNTKMSELCRTTTNYNVENNDAHKKIMTKIDKNLTITSGWVSDVHKRIDDQISEGTDQVNTCHKTFLHAKVFYWVLPFVIAGLLTFAGYTIAKFETYHPPQVMETK